MVRRVRIHPWIVAISGLIATACGAPRLDGLDPPSGPERTLVFVAGDRLLANVLWDAEAPSETTLRSGFLGAYMFSVPPGASQAAHDVQLIRGTKRSAKAAFTVTAPQPFTAPRIDRVSIAGATFKAGGVVTTWLFVQGANTDVGAEVVVDDSVMATVAWKAIRSDRFGVDVNSLGLPIFHHTLLLSPPGDRPVGATLAIKIRNSDGQESQVLNYQLPADQASLDSDGDDLPDDMEVNGFDANNDGTIDVDLPALGANRFRPDVFLEVDVMDSLANPPADAAFTSMIDAFAAAPILNPVDSLGVHLVIDRSGTVGFSQTTDLTGADNPATGFTNFYTFKGASFDDANRGRIFHYCIWANARPGGSSGISDVNFGNGGGDDCIVSFDDFPAAFQTVRSGAETLMHEVGHNLDQRHGGLTHFNRNPAYNSVMSYNWQLRSSQSDATRRSRPVCAPFYYHDPAALEPNGALPAAVNNIVDYSDGMNRDLVENALDETQGVCLGAARDWNSDGDATDAAATFDINVDGDTSDTWTDFANWATLVYRGPRTNGTS
jgi:hypothetical protein